MSEIPEEEESGSEHPPTPLQLAEFVVVPDSGLPDPNYTVGSFLLPPSTEIDAGRVPIILVASAGPQFVVAVPGEAWHRQPALRVLPKSALTKPISVLVAACSCDDREVIVPDTNIKIWLGLLKEQFLDELEFPSSVPELCIFPTEKQEDNYLPSAEALMQIADEKYAFLTAESGSHQGQDPTEDQGLRLSQLEESMAEIRSSLAALLKRPGAVAPVAVELPPAKPRTKPKVPSQQAEGFGFAGLDRQVVQNALAAGVPADHLEQLGKIARQKRTRMTDAPGDLKNKSKLNVLGESEEEDVAVAGEPDAPQLDPHGSDPMSSAVLKLTAIMETLSGTGKKKSRLLEDALDEVGLLGDAASSSSTSSSSRKHAAVLRSLRKATWRDLQHHGTKDARRLWLPSCWTRSSRGFRHLSWLGRTSVQDTQHQHYGPCQLVHLWRFGRPERWQDYGMQSQALAAFGPDGPTGSGPWSVGFSCCRQFGGASSVFQLHTSCSPRLHGSPAYKVVANGLGGSFDASGARAGRIHREALQVGSQVSLANFGEARGSSQERGRERDERWKGRKRQEAEGRGGPASREEPVKDEGVKEPDVSTGSDFFA